MGVLLFLKEIFLKMAIDFSPISPDSRSMHVSPWMTPPPWQTIWMVSERKAELETLNDGRALPVTQVETGSLNHSRWLRGLISFLRSAIIFNSFSRSSWLWIVLKTKNKIYTDLKYIYHVFTKLTSLLNLSELHEAKFGSWFKPWIYKK